MITFIIYLFVLCLGVCAGYLVGLDDRQSHYDDGEF